MDPRVDIYKSALSHQTGAGFDFSVYQGRSNLVTDLTSPCIKRDKKEVVSEMCFKVFGDFFVQLP